MIWSKQSSVLCSNSAGCSTDCLTRTNQTCTSWTQSSPSLPDRRCRLPPKASFSLVRKRLTPFDWLWSTSSAPRMAWILFWRYWMQRLSIRRPKKSCGVPSTSTNSYFFWQRQSKSIWTPLLRISSKRVSKRVYSRGSKIFLPKNSGGPIKKNLSS